MDSVIPHNHTNIEEGQSGLLTSVPFYLFLLQIVAFWKVWQWMASRMASSGEAMWEVIPLIAVAVFAWHSRSACSGIDPNALIFAAAFLVAYGASFMIAPPLIRGLLALISITFILSSWRFNKLFHFGIFILLLLSLPVADSLNFFLGYPMRVVVGEAVQFLLNGQGLDVYREGVGLHFGAKLIWIDAPCSGIKMLWFGTFLATFLACFLRLGAIKILLVLAISFVAILLGNIMRASALFYIEAGLIELGEWMHSGVGLVAFSFTTLLIVFVVKKVSELK